MSLHVSRLLCGILTRQTAIPRCVLGGVSGQMGAGGLWFSPAFTLKTSAPLRSEPHKKKKKVDPRREVLARERLRKKLKKMEKVPAELIPIEDFLTPAKCQDHTRVRPVPALSFEESERRALLVKDWARYKLAQHQAEVQAVQQAVAAQSEAMEELRAEGAELYQAALRPDPALFPLARHGPRHTPASPAHHAPDGRYNDITKVYTQ